MDNPAPTTMRQHLTERLTSRRKELFWSGVAFSVIGALALIFPVFSSISIELMFGWLLTLTGIIGIFGAFQIEGTGQFFGQLLLGLLNVALGLYLLTHPEAGLLTLTLMVAVLFMVDGAWQIGLSFDVRHLGGSWVWVLISGIISIVAGLLIVTALPDASLVLIGLLAGINFLSTGIAFMLLANHIEQDVKKIQPTTPAKPA